MLPQIAGSGIFTPSPFAPSAAERASQGAQPLVGETAASRTRPETANRVDPPRVIAGALPLPEDRRRTETLLPPDPEAPAGPPPAFDATPLERVREAAFATASLIAPSPEPPPERPAPAPVGVAGPQRSDEGPEADEGPSLSDPDEDRRERVEAEVAAVRRMSDPEPERNLDVVR